MIVNLQAAVASFATGLFMGFGLITAAYLMKLLFHIGWCA